MFVLVHVELNGRAKNHLAEHHLILHPSLARAIIICKAEYDTTKSIKRTVLKRGEVVVIIGD